MQRQFKTVCVSGYFDPLHVGHINYFKNAKLLGDKLVVILNNDYQRNHLPNSVITKQQNRKIILESIKYVDEVIISIDNTPSVCQTLIQIKPDIFAKGGEPSSDEMSICSLHNIEVVKDVGTSIHYHDILSSF